MSESKIPQPFQSIGCQDLLKEPVSCVGWLRKRTFTSKLKLFRWPQVYMVLSRGCVYYYRNEFCSKPSGKFSLFGYNSVTRANDVKSTEALFSFRIDHTHRNEFKSYYFSCSSEQEMKHWMKAIKSELVVANDSVKRDSDYYYTQGFSARPQFDQTPETQGSSADSGFGPSGDGDTASIASYKAIEENIYNDVTELQLPDDYGTYAKKANEASDDEDIPDQPPPLPKRKVEKEGHAQKSGRRRKKKRHTSDKSHEQPVSQTNEATETAKNMAAALTSEMKDLTLFNTRKSSKSDSRGERRRGSEEQHSISDDQRKQSIVSESSVDDQEQEEEDDTDEYWKSIHFYGDKNKATEIVRDIGEDGVFLVREGAEGQVLVAWAENTPKKYKIQQKEEKYFLAQAGPNADSLEELLFEYFSIPLPNTTVQLSMPYQQHHSMKE